MQLGTGIVAKAVYVSCVVSLLQTIHGPMKRETLRTSHFKNLARDVSNLSQVLLQFDPVELVLLESNFF